MGSCWFRCLWSESLGCDAIPKFRPIIDTTATTHYQIGKFLSELLHPSTTNEHTVKDTFDAKSRIESIDPALFEQGFKYVSFDVESLFTNVPLEGTLQIIERRVYDEKELSTKVIKEIYTTKAGT